MQFALALKIVTVGCNPELADFTNPRGEIRAEAYVVVAEATSGRRWEHDRVFAGRSLNDDAQCGERAERLRARIERAYAAGRKLNPRHWREVDPAYGSDAYVAQDIDAQRCERERADEWY